MFLVNDLNLYASLDIKLCQLLSVVHNSTKYIRMVFELNKCAKCSLRSGRKISRENIQHKGEIEIRDLEGQEIYKYLGIE